MSLATLPLTPNTCRLLGYLLCTSLPPLADDLPEELKATRELFACDAVLALRPATEAEATLAIIHVANQMQAMDALRLLARLGDDIKRMMQCRAQAASMFRRADATRRALERLQAGSASALPAPLAVRPVAVRPDAAEPTAAEPVAADPIAAEPIAAEPVAAAPVAAQPIAAFAVAAAEPVAPEAVAPAPAPAPPTAAPAEPLAAPALAPAEPIAAQPVGAAACAVAEPVAVAALVAAEPVAPAPTPPAAETAPLQPPPESPQMTPQQALATAEKFARDFPRRATLLRRFARTSEDSQLIPLTKEVVQALATGQTSTLRKLDRRAV